MNNCGLIPLIVIQSGPEIIKFVISDDRKCWNWPKRTGGSDVEFFGILHRNRNLKPIFTQKWASVDMNGGGSTPTPWQFQHW